MTVFSRLRIVSDNAISRASLAASSTAGVLTVANLQRDIKSSVWRAQGTSATITAEWPQAERIGCWGFGFCDFSPTATIRIRGYVGDSVVMDTGMVLACPAPAVKLRGWSAAQAACAYAYGGGSRVFICFNEVDVTRLVVDIVDANNAAGYLEASCAVAAPVWTPQYNAVASLTVVDTTETYRTDAGNQGADAGVIFRRLSLDLSNMPPEDRSRFVNLVRQSRAYPILVSPFQGWGDTALESDYTVYGRRTGDSDVASEYVFLYSSKLELEEI